MEESDDGGGSFWATFGGPASGPAELSPLETLLQSPDCSVEALLEDEECIQEFKSGNEKLLARLRKLDACLLLVEYITRDPPADAPHARCYKYPFVAVELMTCNPEIFTFFVQPENTQLLDELWGFLEATPPSELNPVLAGYFSRAVAILLSRKTPEVVEYIRRRKWNSKLLECFLDRMHSRSLAELFARLVCQEMHSQMIFPVEGLIMRLLSRLQDALPMSDTQENITLVILELINQKDCVCFGNELMTQLTSSAVIKLLVDRVFSGKAASVAAAASILSSIVQNTCFGNGNEGRNFGSSPTLTPVSPPLLSIGRGADDDDLVNTGMEDPLDDLEAVPARASTSSTSPPSSPSRMTSNGENPGAPGSALMREVILYIPRIRALLDAVLGRGVDMVPLPGGEVPGVGSTTVEVMNLLTMLVRTDSEAIYEAMQQEHLLPRCLEIFFRHPWSSLLHNSVSLMLKDVLGSTSGVRPALVLQLLQENGLVERLVNEYRVEKEYSSGPRKRHPRVGYMGHLHEMCQGLVFFGRDVEQCGAALEAVSGWTDVVLVSIALIDKQYGEKLGGGIPEGSAGLATTDGISAATRAILEAYDNAQVSGGISGAMQSAAEPLDDDFVLDDLGDFDGSPTRAGSDSSSPTRSSDFMGGMGLDGGFDPDSFSSPTSSDSGGSGGVSSSRPEAWTASFGADFSQASSFDADFGQAKPFEADFSQPNGFEADFSRQAAPAAAPEEPAIASSGSFWDTAATASETPATASKPPPSSDWAAFGATAPTSSATVAAKAVPKPAPKAQPLEPNLKEDLLSVLGGSSPCAGTEKRDSGSWGANFSWPAPPSSPAAASPVAVPSSCASTSLNDLSWDAFGSGTSKPTQPSNPVGAPAVGAENLFALLGETPQVTSAPAMPVAAAPMGAPAPAAAAPAASPWQWDNFGSAASSASPSGTSGGNTTDPFGALVPPASPAGSDSSWVADFDPFGGATPPAAAAPAPFAAAWPQDRSSSNGQKPDVASLDPFTFS